jgi:hypothetical protein
LQSSAVAGYPCCTFNTSLRTKALSFGGVQVPAEAVQVAYVAALNGTFAKVLSTAELCTG